MTRLPESAVPTPRLAPPCHGKVTAQQTRKSTSPPTEAGEVSSIILNRIATHMVTRNDFRFHRIYRISHSRPPSSFRSAQGTEATFSLIITVAASRLVPEIKKLSQRLGPWKRRKKLSQPILTSEHLCRCAKQPFGVALGIKKRISSVCQTPIFPCHAAIAIAKRLNWHLSIALPLCQIRGTNQKWPILMEAELERPSWALRAQSSASAQHGRSSSTSMRRGCDARSGNDTPCSRHSRNVWMATWVLQMAMSDYTYRVALPIRMTKCEIFGCWGAPPPMRPTVQRAQRGTVWQFGWLEYGWLGSSQKIICDEGATTQK